MSCPGQSGSRCRPKSGASVCLLMMMKRHFGLPRCSTGKWGWRTQLGKQLMEHPRGSESSTRQPPGVEKKWVRAQLIEENAVHAVWCDNKRNKGACSRQPDTFALEPRLWGGRKSHMSSKKRLEPHHFRHDKPSGLRTLPWAACLNFKQ